VAILVGDVSGNWGSAGGAAGEELAGTPVEIEIEQKLSDDGEMELLVWVKPNGQEIYSLDLELDYDGADMNTLEIKQGSDSTFASSEAGVDDHLRIAMASATPLTSDALLMSISVQADGLGQVAAVANEQTANVHVEMNEPAMSLVRSAAIPGRALH